jgi:hypothetical protein
MAKKVLNTNKHTVCPIPASVPPIESVIASMIIEIDISVALNNTKGLLPNLSTVNIATSQ